MARPRKMISLEEQIKKQKETVLKVKEKYDSEMMKLKDLYAKRNEEKKKDIDTAETAWYYKKVRRGKRFPVNGEH